jgi:hypothetical protein
MPGALSVADVYTNFPALYAVVAGLHVLAIALLVGPIILVDLQRLTILRNPALAAAHQSLERAARIGLVLAGVTGAALFAAGADDYLALQVFLTKMVCVALGAVNALASARGLMRPKLGAALSLLFWLSALGLRRAIAFAQ